MGAILHAVSVPDCGGDTLFSDMYAAYDGLDQATKDEIDELAGGARLHPDLRAHHVRRGAPEGAGAVPAGAPSRWCARTPPPGSCTSTSTVPS